TVQTADSRVFAKIEPCNGEVIVETDIACRKTKSSAKYNSRKKSGKEFFDEDLKPTLMHGLTVIWRLPRYVFFGTKAAIAPGDGCLFITDVVRELAKHFTFDELRQKLIIEYRYDGSMQLSFVDACWRGIRDCGIHIRQNKLPPET
ncbi:MAG: hypothetical protein OYH77_07390, partial [Pseudomonadota bacterium]|nr:hypothetical protein [Pseudomonadota bacterium]